METGDVDECRVAVHTGAGSVDLTLSSEVPIALLLPGVCDIVDRHLSAGTGAPRYLRLPGAQSCDTSKSLSENGIREGDTVILATSEASAGPRVTLDGARALADEVNTAAAGWTPVDSRVAALLAAVILTGAAGLVAVAGAPGPPRLLLTASAAGSAAAVAARVSGRWRMLFTAFTFGAALTAAVALWATVTGGGTGALLAVAGLAVLLGAARLTLSICGLAATAARDLTADPGPAAHPASAPGYLRALVAAGTGTCTLGLIAIAGVGGPAEGALAGVVSVVMLLRARVLSAPGPRISVLLGGACGVAATLGAAARLWPTWWPWLCGAALCLAAGALWATHRPFPAGPRAVEVLRVLDCALSAAVIPLACWSLGFFDAVRTAAAR